MAETSNDPLVCKCGNKLGTKYYLEGKFIGAMLGGMLVNESAHGVCAQCGRGVHVVVSRKSYLELMSHYMVAAPALEVEISE